MPSNSEPPIMIGEKTVAVLGIGGAGVKMLSHLLNSKTPDFMKVGVMDFDATSLGDFKGEHKISSETVSKITNGCGGDIIIGERMTAMARSKIANFAEGSSYCIVACGLGGGTGTAGAPIAARMIKTLGIPSIVLTTIPFSFEGHQKRQIAETGIEMLLTDADVVISIHSDILFSVIPAETSLKKSFEKVNIDLAAAIKCVAELITAKNYLSGTFADFKRILGKQKTSCAIGTGSATKEEGTDFHHLAVERLLNSPLLGGVAELKRADAAAIVISGDSELGIGAIKKTFEKIKELFSDNTDIICSVNDASNMHSTIRISVLTAKYENPVSPSDIDFNVQKDFYRKIQPDESGTYTQEELPIMRFKKGIFANSSDNYFGNQDLDIPTFQRKGIIVDTGK
jgi:cell division protein FtsZ